MGVDFKFQADRSLGRLVFGFDGIFEFGRDLTAFEDWVTKPRIENVVHPVQQGLERPLRRLHQIDILGITKRLRKVEFVECGAAAKAQLSHQERIIEEFDQRPGDDEILLDLPLFRPRRVLRPSDDVHGGNHSSISG
ncbi:hypothetical protein ES703_97302 [subsurface metagenome]